MAHQDYFANSKQGRIFFWAKSGLCYRSSIMIIIIKTSLFREDDILSNANYLSDIWSSMIKIMYLNYRQICTIYTYTI